TNMGNSTTAGTGANPGWAVGNDAFFLTGASITLDPNGGTITLSNSIADDSSASFIGIMSGTTPGTALGATIAIGNPLSSPGIVHLLSNQNSFSGGIHLNHGILQVADD